MHIYYVIAWNELGASEPSLATTATTTSQSNILASKVPEDLTAILDDNARASNYIDGYAQLNWNSKEYLEHPFNLAYSGNPYSPQYVHAPPEVNEFRDVHRVAGSRTQPVIGPCATSGHWVLRSPSSGPPPGFTSVCAPSNLRGHPRDQAKPRGGTSHFPPASLQTDRFRKR